MLILSTLVPLMLLGMCPPSYCFILSTINSFGFAGIELKIAVLAPGCQGSALLKAILLPPVIRLMTLMKGVRGLTVTTAEHTALMTPILTFIVEDVLVPI